MSAAGSAPICDGAPSSGSPGRGGAVLFTLGYERASFAEFLAVLQAAGVGTVIDVRDLPLSRRAGFSKRQLAAGLAEGGIGYHHLKALGTPKEGRTAHRQGDMARFWALVEGRLATPEADHAIAYAAALAMEKPACLVCFEADHRICHRDRVAARLVADLGCRLDHLSLPAPL